MNMESTKMKLLHFTAHLGGGIGAAYIGLGKCGFDQTVILLEEPKNTVNVQRVTEAGFQVLVTPSRRAIEEEIRNADVCVFSWWHHPKMAEFMVNFPEIPVRSVLWVHVSGNYFPHIYPEFLMLFDRIAFATPFTMTLPEVKQLGADLIAKKTEVVYGLGDLAKFANIAPVEHKKYTVMYIGTLNFNKLNPEFVDFCAAVDVPDVEFAMVGDTSSKDIILCEASKKGIADKFRFYGHVDNVCELLSKADVFGYLLNPQHFGATENALIEAIAAGVPVVALNQCVEKVIVNNWKTGLLVSDKNEYAKAIRFIYENPDSARKIAKEARKEALRTYALESNNDRFASLCESCMHETKKYVSCRGMLGETPAEWFLSAVGSDKNCFTDNHAYDAGMIFKENEKASPIHYSSVFPEDRLLGEWVRQIKEN